MYLETFEFMMILSEQNSIHIVVLYIDHASSSPPPWLSPFFSHTIPKRQFTKKFSEGKQVHVMEPSKTK